MSRIRANQITNQSADGAPTVQNGLVISGVTTSTTFSGSGASLTNLPSAQLTGALPALDGSNLTGISAGTSLSGSTNNTVCTVTGANAIQGEANLTFDGTELKIGGDSSVAGTFGLEVYNTASNEANNHAKNLLMIMLEICEEAKCEESSRRGRRPRTKHIIALHQFRDTFKMIFMNNIDKLFKTCRISVKKQENETC